MSDLSPTMLTLLKSLRAAGGGLPAGAYKAPTAWALVSRGLALWQARHHDTWTALRGLDITELGRERLVEAEGSE